MNNIIGDYSFSGLYEYLYHKELVGEFDTAEFDTLDMIHQLFINVAQRVSKFRILTEIKFWFKKLIIGREMAEQWVDLRRPDKWDLPFVENALLDLRVRLLFQD